jgi:hypothetical protein
MSDSLGATLNFMLLDMQYQGYTDSQFNSALNSKWHIVQPIILLWVYHVLRCQ